MRAQAQTLAPTTTPGLVARAGSTEDDAPLTLLTDSTSLSLEPSTRAPTATSGLQSNAGAARTSWALTSPLGMVGLSSSVTQWPVPVAVPAALKQGAQAGQTTQKRTRKRKAVSALASTAAGPAGEAPASAPSGSPPGPVLEADAVGTSAAAISSVLVDVEATAAAPANAVAAERGTGAPGAGVVAARRLRSTLPLAVPSPAAPIAISRPGASHALSLVGMSACGAITITSSATGRAMHTPLEPAVTDSASSGVSATDSLIPPIPVASATEGLVADSASSPLLLDPSLEGFQAAPRHTQAAATSTHGGPEAEQKQRHWRGHGANHRSPTATLRGYFVDGASASATTGSTVSPQQAHRSSAPGPVFVAGRARGIALRVTATATATSASTGMAVASARGAHSAASASVATASGRGPQSTITASDKAKQSPPPDLA